MLIVIGINMLQKNLLFNLLNFNIIIKFWKTRMNKIVLTFLVACNLAAMVNCHGYLMDPINRMSGIYQTKKKCIQNT